MKGYEVCYWTTGEDYTKKEYEYLNNAVENAYFYFLYTIHKRNSPNGLSSPAAVVHEKLK